MWTLSLTLPPSHNHFILYFSSRFVSMHALLYNYSQIISIAVYSAFFKKILLIHKFFHFKCDSFKRFFLISLNLPSKWSPLSNSSKVPDTLSYQHLLQPTTAYLFVWLLFNFSCPPRWKSSMKMEAFFLCSPLLSERKELYYLLANIKFLFVFYSIAGTQSLSKNSWTDFHQTWRVVAECV